MPNVGSHARAKCPFFKREKGNAIVCESPAEGSRLLMVFNTNEMRDAWQKCRCETFDYANVCPLAAMMERVYGIEQDREDGTA